jgi:hypothetical protein
MNRHLNKPCLTALLLLSLVGCDFRGSSSVAGSDSSSDSSSDISSDVSADPTMTTGLSYPVTDGSQVVSTSPTPAQVQITHELIGQQRTVTLLQGSAELYE